MRLTTIVAALILSVVVATKICAIEPEDLIGKWSGEYRSSSRSGSYTVYWIVTEVSGERVAGVLLGRVRELPQPRLVSSASSRATSSALNQFHSSMDRQLAGRSE